MSNIMDSPIKVLLVISWFFSLNITFNAFNKYVFTVKEKGGAGMSVPLLCTMSHALAGMLAAMFFTLFPKIYTRKKIEDPKMYLNICGIAAFFAASIGLNNSSLQFLALSMQQIIRSVLPAVVAICAFLIEGKTFTKEQIGTLCLLVLGVMLSVMGDTSGTEALGVFLCLGSVAGTAMQYIFVSLCMNPENKLKGFDVLLYTGIPTMLVLTPAMILNKEPQKISAFAEEKGWDTAIGYILIGQALAISYNLTTYFFISALSATYLTVCGVFKVVLVIGFSVIVLGDEIGTVNAIGLIIAMAGFSGNSYLKFQEKAKSG